MFFPSFLNPEHVPPLVFPTSINDSTILPIPHAGPRCFINCLFLFTSIQLSTKSCQFNLGESLLCSVPSHCLNSCPQYPSLTTSAASQLLIMPCSRLSSPSSVFLTSNGNIFKKHNLIKASPFLKSFKDFYSRPTELLSAT